MGAGHEHISMRAGESLHLNLCEKGSPRRFWRRESHHPISVLRLSLSPQWRKHRETDWRWLTSWEAVEVEREHLGRAACQGQVETQLEPRACLAPRRWAIEDCWGEAPDSGEELERESRCWGRAEEQTFRREGDKLGVRAAVSEVPVGVSDGDASHLWVQESPHWEKRERPSTLWPGLTFSFCVMNCHKHSNSKEHTLITSQRFCRFKVQSCHNWAQGLKSGTRPGLKSQLTVGALFQVHIVVGRIHFLLPYDWCAVSQDPPSP